MTVPAGRKYVVLVAAIARYARELINLSHDLNDLELLQRLRHFLLACTAAELIESFLDLDQEPLVRQFLVEVFSK